MGDARTIVQESSQNVVIMDVMSRLVQDRIIFIGDVITGDLANGVIAQMLYLDSKDSSLPISIYINTPGGSVYDGLAIYDIAMKIKSPIHTVCIGMAASMGAILMLCGEKRQMTKHGRIMIHQPQGRTGGTCDEIEIECAEIVKLKAELFEIIEERTPIENARELFKLDKWYSSTEALEIGLVTEIL